MEFRFFEPPRETKIGSKNRGVREIGGKISVFDWEEGTTFGPSYREVRKIEGSRNRDSTVYTISNFKKPPNLDQIVRKQDLPLFPQYIND